MPKLPLRPNVCLLILDPRGRLFLGERRGCPGVWQLPQGGVDPGLTEEECALKEAHEELGAPRERFRILTRLSALNEYDFDEPPPRARGKWRGQSQRFWVLRYLGADDEIDLDRFEPELMAWRWCSVGEVRRLAEPKRVRGYESALAEFEEWARRTGAPQSG